MERKKRRAMLAINEIYSDNSVSQTETHKLLQELIDECRELQQALDEAEQNK